MLILRGLIGGLFQVSLFGSLLIVPAGLIPGGTWYWPRALLFLGVYGCVLVISIVALAIKAPASLEARLKPLASKKQPFTDRLLTLALVLWFVCWFVSIPIDVFFWKLLPTPGFAASGFGAVLTAAGFAIIMAAIYENSFAAPIVEDQTDVGQVLIDTGPYARVRHPLYLGFLPFVAGISLWLESYTSLIVGFGSLVWISGRIVVEERMLRHTLPGYSEYVEKVPYRLVPFVW
ncbi:MAG: isoprenylcysteine carboxylmethyltransferase family protein [Acidobacteriota bacterium]|nr:isoprenylcysteine carboxylmethyltransferase family protein [Acidobacteriota bacterium]